MEGSGPLLVLDFDGVINMLGSATSVRRSSHVLGHQKRTELSCDGVVFPIRYSSELVGRLRRAVLRSGAEWVWLTTWNAYSMSEINPNLGTTGRRWIPWDSGAGRRSGLPEDERILARSMAKYAALRDEIAADARPFIWVDDEAGAEFEDSDFEGDLDVPRLVIVPDPDIGISRAECDQIEDFLAKHGQDGTARGA